MNTSATGGYLAPDAGAIAAPLEDDALDDFLHDVVVGVTGLANELVRPRWQEEPPNLPAFGTDWVAVGVPNRTRDTYAVVQHDETASAGAGADILIRHEHLEVLCSFYGPHCQALATLLADGMLIPQNREELRAAGMAVKQVGEPTKAPEMIKGRWLPRADLTVWVSREIRRSYPVLNLVSAQATLDVEAIEITITATP